MGKYRELDLLLNMAIEKHEQGQLTDTEMQIILNLVRKEVNKKDNNGNKADWDRLFGSILN